MAQVKAFNLRGIVSVLVRERRLGDVTAIVSAPTRALLEDPPVNTVWIESHAINEVYAAIAKKWGDQELRRMMRASMEQGALLVLRPAVEAVMRIFGVSPATLLSRLPMFSSPNTRGFLYEYISDSPTSARIRMTLTDEHDVPRAAFVALAGALESALDLTRARGTVAEPEIVKNGRGNIGELRVNWG